jgi:hypothetical protein
LPCNNITVQVTDRFKNVYKKELLIAELEKGIPAS